MDGRVLLNSRLPEGRNNEGIDLEWWVEMELDCMEVYGNTAGMTEFTIRSGPETPRLLKVRFYDYPAYVETGDRVAGNVGPSS